MPRSPLPMPERVEMYRTAEQSLWEVGEVVETVKELLALLCSLLFIAAVYWVTA